MPRRSGTMESGSLMHISSVLKNNGYMVTIYALKEWISEGLLDFHYVGNQMNVSLKDVMKILYGSEPAAPGGNVA